MPGEMVSRSVGSVLDNGVPFKICKKDLLSSENSGCLLWRTITGSLLLPASKCRTELYNACPFPNTGKAGQAMVARDARKAKAPDYACYSWRQNGMDLVLNHVAFLLNLLK